jgi:hypothetical protein
MGFMSGVITGVAAAAVAAAWYLSRSGERIRSQYRIEDRLAQLGDELDARTRDIQAALNAQLAELRGASDAEVRGSATAMDATLDPVAASAAEAEAEAAAAEAPVDVAADDAPTKRTRKPKVVASE